MARIREWSGVLVVHAWVEGAAPEGLRARITQIRDLEGERTETSAVTIDETVAIVRDWLEDLVADPRIRR